MLNAGKYAISMDAMEDRFPNNKSQGSSYVRSIGPWELETTAISSPELLGLWYANQQAITGSEQTKTSKPDPKFTLLETNIAFENRPLEKEIPIGSHHF